MVHETNHEDEDTTTEEIGTRKLLFEKCGSKEMIQCKIERHEGHFFAKEIPKAKVEIAKQDNMGGRIHTIVDLLQTLRPLPDITRVQV